MYVFAMLSMPLSFMAVSAWTFSVGDKSGRAFARGLLFGLPAALVWVLVRRLLMPVWGSPVLAIIFFARYWALPLGLTTLAYAAAVGFSSVARDGEYDRLVSFFMGSLSVFGVAHAISSWGGRSAVFSIYLPLMLVATALAFPYLLEEAVKDGMPGALKPLALATLGCVVAAFGTAFFFMRLEWLGYLTSALYTAGATALGLSRLLRAPHGARRGEAWDQRGSNPPPTA